MGIIIIVVLYTDFDTAKIGIAARPGKDKFSHLYFNYYEKNLNLLIISFLCLLLGMHLTIFADLILNTAYAVRNPPVALCSLSFCINSK
jgi:hypothetical protein